MINPPAAKRDKRAYPSKNGRPIRLVPRRVAASGAVSRILAYDDVLRERAVAAGLHAGLRLAIHAGN
jgi:hypothetical protein